MSKKTNSCVCYSLTGPPVITEQPMTTAARLEHDVELLCNATGNPVPTITWDYANQENLDIADIPTVINSTTVTSSLLIPILDISDFQFYSCIATNLAGSVNASALLGGMLRKCAQYNNNIACELCRHTWTIV